MKRNACGKITKKDAFICKECGEVNCIECRVKNPKGLKLPICTLCGTYLLSSIWEEENKKEEDARLQIKIPEKLLEVSPEPELDMMHYLKPYSCSITGSCSQCSLPIYSTYTSYKHLDRELGKEHKFCSERCADKFIGEHLCNTCGSRVGVRYYFCFWCLEKSSYCSASCLQDHKENTNTLICILSSIEYICK